MDPSFCRNTLSLTAYPTGFCNFDHTLETLSNANLPASVTGLLKASSISLSHCLLGLPLPLFPFILPSKIIFPNPHSFSNDQTISAFVSSQSSLAIVLPLDILLLTCSFCALSKKSLDFFCNTSFQMH